MVMMAGEKISNSANESFGKGEKRYRQAFYLDNGYELNAIWYEIQFDTIKGC